MAAKSKFVAFRAEPGQQKKLIDIAQSLGEGKNMSAALRWLVDQAPEKPGPWMTAGQQESAEVVHG